MRSGDEGRQDLPAEEPVEALPDGDRHLWVHEPQTPADRAAARRRLDRLAEEAG